MMFVVFFFFFKQKTAYEMRISDWSSDVCSSDLRPDRPDRHARSPPRSKSVAQRVPSANPDFPDPRRREKRFRSLCVEYGPCKADASARLLSQPRMICVRRSEEHTSELPVTNAHLVCRLLLEKQKKKIKNEHTI